MKPHQNRKVLIYITTWPSAGHKTNPVYLSRLFIYHIVPPLPNAPLNRVVPSTRGIHSGAFLRYACAAGLTGIETIVARMTVPCKVLQLVAGKHESMSWRQQGYLLQSASPSFAEYAITGLDILVPYYSSGHHSCTTQSRCHGCLPTSHMPCKTSSPAEAQIRTSCPHMLSGCPRRRRYFAERRCSWSQL